MLRITLLHDKSTVEIRVEGRLEEAGVVDLKAHCRSAGMPLQLDLSGLLSADEVGIYALQSLYAAGVELHGASPYINDLLKTETL